MGDQLECSICHCQFDLELDGGAQGAFGLLPVAFCPSCYACCVEMGREHLEQGFDDDGLDSCPPPLNG